MRNQILSLLVLLLTMATGTTRAYEVQIGEGTNTTGYFPFYTLYNYSISECLFRASELTAAGVEAGPITSLSWYAANAPGYEQQGISMWVANVTDTELTTTSHVTTNMTLVYTGSCTPDIGWNEFVFNEDSFKWDGTSNLLIYCQRNNGNWNSSVQWQATNVSDAGFNAMSYNYEDNGAYDATVTNTMYVSTLRPNIIIKGEAASIKVTINEAKTEASFAMPGSDATVEYELVRDMAKSVTTTMNASLFRIMEDRLGGYKPVEGMPTPELTVKDELGTEAVTMTEGTTAAPADYTAVLQMLTSEEGAQEEEWTDVSAEDGPTLGTYRYAITGQGDYDGTIYSPTFQMSLRIPAEISFAQTSLNKDKGDVFVNTLTNTGDGEVTYKLTGDNIATIDPETGKVTITGQPGVVTVTATVKDSGDYSYETKSVSYVISVGLPLANPPYDYDDQSIGAHKLALLTVINIAKEIDLTNKTDKSANKLKMVIAECEKLLTSKTVTHEELDEARIRLLTAIDNLEDKVPADADADIANGQNQENEETTGVRPIDNGQLRIENWYTLNGRKLDKKPTKKGVYILNGKKTIVK